jgi:diguanylate cyclase (GGDEF)-like protein/PAS domain S-box-containing protein
MNPAASVPALTLRLALLALVLYGLAALLSIRLSAQPGQIAAPWFANPIGTVALLALPTRRWLPMLLALGLVNLLVNLGTMPGAWRCALQTCLEAAAFVPGNAAEMLLAALLLRHLGMDADTLRQPGRFGRVLVLGGLLPTFCSAFAGAALVVASARSFAEAWTQWFAGSLIGTVAVLPLALALWLHGTGALRRLLRQPRTLGYLALSAAITLLAMTTLPRPFVVMSIGLVLVATQTSFTVTTLATLVNTVLLALLHTTDVLVPPPADDWWEPGLYQISVIASLLPGLLLSSSMEGQTQAMRHLLASEQRFRSLYTRTPALMHSIDPQGRILSVSGLWLQTLGYEEHEVLGHHTTEFMTPETARYARDVVIPQAKRNGRCDNVEYQMRTRDGRVLDVLLSAIWLYDKDGQPLHSLAVLQDVTEKKRLQALSYYAAHDPLTGLPNRVLLQDRLERSCVQHARHGTRFAVGFLDLDRFKAVNDTYGHDAGDLLLKRVARRLLAALRASDTVCRLAGDEFVLLFADVEHSEDLAPLVQKILASVAQPYRLGDGPESPVVSVAASMGLALFPEHGQDPQTLMSHADKAMYAVKRGGRGRYEFYRPDDPPV